MVQLTAAPAAPRLRLEVLRPLMWWVGREGGGDDGMDGMDGMVGVGTEDPSYRRAEAASWGE